MARTNVFQEPTRYRVERLKVTGGMAEVGAGFELAVVHTGLRAKHAKVKRYRLLSQSDFRATRHMLYRLCYLGV